MKQTAIRENFRNYIGLVFCLVLVVLIAPNSHYQMSQPDASGHRAEQAHDWVGGWVRVSRQTQYDPAGQVVERSAWQVAFQPRLRPLVYLLILAGLIASYSLLGRDRPAQTINRWGDRLALVAGSLVRGGCFAFLAFLVVGLLGPRPVVHEWRSMDAALLERAEPALAEHAAATVLPARIEREVEADGMTVLRLSQHRNLATNVFLDGDGLFPVVPELQQTNLSMHMPIPWPALWLGGLIGLLIFGWTLRQAFGGGGRSDGPLTGSTAST